MWYAFWMTNRWLLLRFDLLGATAVLITTLFGLFAMNTVGYAGWAGVTISEHIARFAYCSTDSEYSMRHVAYKFYLLVLPIRHST